MRTFSSLLRFPKTRKQVDLFVCSLSYMALCVGKMNAKTCKSYASDKRSRFGFYSKHPTRSCQTYQHNLKLYYSYGRPRQRYPDTFLCYLESSRICRKNMLLIFQGYLKLLCMLEPFFSCSCSLELFCSIFFSANGNHHSDFQPRFSLCS